MCFFVGSRYWLCGLSAYLQCYVDVGALAVDVVGIERFGVAAAQYATFAASLAVVDAFPGFKHIGAPLFRSGLFYCGRCHLFVCFSLFSNVKVAIMFVIAKDL